MTSSAQFEFSYRQGGAQNHSNLRRLRPLERPFVTAERAVVTILFGGLTWKHEKLIEGVLRGAGYRCRRLPETDRSAHELGKEFCATALCNPVYFTVGNLIRFLRQLEESGLSRKEIVRDYVYFTAACGGPCRFGMYESEFRNALNTAGYDGFRVLSFSQDRGIGASTGQSGLQFSVDFGMNAMHAFIIGDILHDVQHRLRPFELQPGSTDRVIARVTDGIAEHFENHRGFELSDHLPPALVPDRALLRYRLPNTAGKLCSHLWGGALTAILARCHRELAAVEVDWLRVKPVVKVMGEFWAQMTESDGNFQMLKFLENEDAEVSVEPVSTWVLYMLHQRKAMAEYRSRMNAYLAPWSVPGRAFIARLSALSRQLVLRLAERAYLQHFLRLARAIGVRNVIPVSQRALSDLAAPWYNTFLRGGEGHLEVGKTLYYTQHRLCHLVLALKPFGCLPSMQSDAVQACLVERFPDVNFLPIETSAEGEIHAYSRVQMALSEARARASSEFERALTIARHSLEDIRSFVSMNALLRHPFCPIPRYPGIVSTAANFLLYVDHFMSAGNMGSHSPVGYRIAELSRLRSSEEIRP